MIQDWREHFANPKAWFGFVLLEPWITTGPLAEFRAAQLKSTTLPMVSYGSAIDIGDPQSPFGSVHPRHKQVPAHRLVLGALNLVYEQSTVAFIGPTPLSAVDRSTSTDLVVEILFTAATVDDGLELVQSSCPTNLGVDEALCSWFSIEDSAGKAHNATATLSLDKQSVLLAAPASGVQPVKASFGYSVWPVVTLYATNGLPSVPFVVDVRPK
jgi:hypothetical protein